MTIPAFTRCKTQLTEKEVEFSLRLARVRIHMERVIGRLKNKYTILQLDAIKIQMTWLKLIILISYAALTNLFPGIVPYCFFWDWQLSLQYHYPCGFRVRPTHTKWNHSLMHSSLSHATILLDTSLLHTNNIFWQGLLQWLQVGLRQ